MPQGNQPVFILQEGTEQRRGKTAQDNNISAAIAVGDAVKSTLGPKGMDKMLVDSTGGVIITNDGATILREAGIEHPAAKMVVEVSQTQEARCYDGTTSAVVLSAELLRQSQALLDKGIHHHHHPWVSAGSRLRAERPRRTVHLEAPAVGPVGRHLPDREERGEQSRTARQPVFRSD